MSAILDVSTAPFDRLSPEEAEILDRSLDVAGAQQQPDGQEVDGGRWIGGFYQVLDKDPCFVVLALLVERLGQADLESLLGWSQGQGLPELLLGLLRPSQT